MSLFTLFLLLILTCVVFWLFRIAYNHAGAVPEAPAFVKWSLQGITIVVLIIVVPALWGLGGGYISGPELRLR